MTTTITAAAPDIESLVRDYYIDSSRFIYDDDYDNTKKQQHQQEWSNGEHEDDRDDSSFCYRYCDICMLDRADWLKYYCYSNKGLNRQLITICLKCMDKYKHKKYEPQLQRLERFVDENNACLNNSNGQRTVTIGGVIDIETADKAKEKIMLALKLAMNANNNNKKNSSAITSDVDDDYLFCRAVRMAYDQSELVHIYFRNNPSKISANNAR
jgi:hypothetical protein